MADMGFLPEVTSLLDPCRPEASGCCSRPPSTARSTRWSAATSPTRCGTRSRPPRPPPPRWSTRSASCRRPRRSRSPPRSPPARPDPAVRAHQARRRPAGAAAGPCRRPGRRPPRRPGPAGQRPCPGRVRRGTVPVLVATDVAARGIHVDGIDLVVHFDPPADPKDYLHRSGRTARAGAAGTVVTLVLPEQADRGRQAAPTSRCRSTTSAGRPGAPAADGPDRPAPPRRPPTPSREPGADFGYAGVSSACPFPEQFAGRAPRRVIQEVPWGPTGFSGSSSTAVWCWAGTRTWSRPLDGSRPSLTGWPWTRSSSPATSTPKPRGDESIRQRPSDGRPRRPSRKTRPWPASPARPRPGGKGPRRPNGTMR